MVPFLPLIHTTMSWLRTQTSLKTIQSGYPQLLRCFMSSESSATEIARRTANFMPTIWDPDRIQSIRSDFKEEEYISRTEALKKQFKALLRRKTEPIAPLELIDSIQRLGVGYHFEQDIKVALDTIYSNADIQQSWSDDLYATSLAFRLLRQHGYRMSSDVFCRFMDEKGSFEVSLIGDAKGMLSLYEACHLSVPGEDILDKAFTFTSKNLMDLTDRLEPSLSQKVQHALELPLHWRMVRLEARDYIQVYEKEKDMIPSLLEFAKLDFNSVQCTHQADLRRMSRWYNDMGFATKLPFARDRIVENCLWIIGYLFEPQFSRTREALIKIHCLITAIDDVYDVYGSLDELELFTEAVQRWDLNAMEKLPYYMKICYLALYNTTNMISYDILKEKGWNITNYLKEVWAGLGKANMLEAKWFSMGHKPTLEEYLNNSRVSSSVPVLLVHVYFLIAQSITQEAIDDITTESRLIYWSSMVLRLCNDLVTSPDEILRGVVPKSIQCYMHETGASEEAARKHIKEMIRDAWKKLNAECLAPSILPKPYVNFVVNLARMAHCAYSNGDGFTKPDSETREHINRLFIHSIPLD
ncbi:(-)-alpha-terpineol synthase isoform X2 [Amborella trichopoda]|uniref:(-)-alpha-terpineol synthase isoform X2 n=1 Tax=Amborella trichopoda TaxID=13333 RepID=UPI0005D35033|nr:(-)-alpha-terpineol synthase isoform X2 [Amborella trichopoda]|eukprot:XP_011623138.1 (-)-alpha-terpineol synthase isoform X2 [Amborella trichopoda]